MFLPNNKQMKSKKFLPLLFLAFLNNPLNASQFQTTVENIINEFAQNSIVAEDKYMNKKINLTKGEILSIDDSVFSEFVGQNDVSVLIQPQPKNAFDFSFDTISCVHNRNESIVRELRKGMKVEITGLLIGEEWGLVFKDCRYTSSDLKSTGNELNFNSSKNGLQTEIYNNGDKYVGDFVDGKRSGKGTYTWASGNKYIGDFIDGKRTGNGTFIWASGDKYDGDKYVGGFVDGKRSGKGTYTWASGNKYIGDWVDGKRTGKGTYIWVSGDKYVGDFVDGKRSGKGTYTWVEGDKYIGDFVDGKRTGKGTFIWVDGGKYVGGFVDGKIEGEGIYTPVYGEILEGKFENGTLVESYKLDESTVENEFNESTIENEFKGFIQNFF